MEAAEIFSRACKIYREASSYRDEGTLAVTRGEVDKPGLTVKFKTHFKRPHMYRFEATQSTRSSTNHNILWCDGKVVARQSNQYIQQLSEHFLFRNTMKDLDRALSSVQEAQPIASLLFENLSGKQLSELQNIKVIGEEMCEGQACYHLRSEAHNLDVDLWISTLSFGIARIVERQLVPDNQDTLKVTGQPQRAKKIPVVSEFNFNAVALNDNFPANVFQIPANK